jgi:hypothetical protein
MFAQFNPFLLFEPFRAGNLDPLAGALIEYRTADGVYFRTADGVYFGTAS